MEAEELDKFREINKSKYPDLYALPLPNQALWILLVAKDQLHLTELTAWDIAKVLTRVYGVSATGPGILYALKHTEGKKVHKKKAHRKKKSITLFSIMEEGKRSLLSSRSVLLIDPAAAFTGLKNFEQMLADLQGEVCICDPWVDKNTLDVISMIPNKCKVRLLTLHVKDHRSFKRYYGAFNRQYRHLEIKISQKPILHDRYMISPDVMWLIGQSLNGIGKKQTFIVQVGEEIKQQMARLFNKIWSEAKSI